MKTTKNQKGKKRLILDKLPITKLTNSRSIIGGTGGNRGDGTEDRMGTKARK